jgi:phage recombination protein Bet
MANNNTLQPARKKPSDTYEAGGMQIRLTINDIKNFLVTGDGQVSDKEAMMFLAICRGRRLNPWARDAYLIKYGSKQPAAVVVSKAAQMRMALSNPRFRGYACGVIVKDADGVIHQIEGTYYDSEESRLVGGWCRVHIDGWDVSPLTTVPLDEYIQRKADGTVNSMWSSKPATMICKVAVAHAMRDSMPGELGGLYTQEETPAAQEVVLDERPLDPDTLPRQPQPAELPQKAQAAAPVATAKQPEAAGQPSDVMAALFGEA